MIVATLQGVKETMYALNRDTSIKAENFERGLKKAGLYILRISKKVVPVDTSALKNSGFTRQEGKGFLTEVTVGYTTHYAVWVHENMQARHKPGKQAKYLEGPVRREIKKIVTIIRDTATGQQTEK